MIAAACVVVICACALIGIVKPILDIRRHDRSSGPVGGKDIDPDSW